MSNILIDDDAKLIIAQRHDKKWDSDTFFNSPDSPNDDTFYNNLSEIERLIGTIDSNPKDRERFFELCIETMPKILSELERLGQIEEWTRGEGYDG